MLKKKRQFCRQEGRCHSAKWKVKHKTLGCGVCHHVSSMFRVEPTKCIEGITKQKHRGHKQDTGYEPVRFPGMHIQECSCPWAYHEMILAAFLDMFGRSMLILPINGQ